MEFHTNDFQVAMMQIAYEMSQMVTEIEGSSIPRNINTDDLTFKRAKLVRDIFEKLATPPSRS